MKSCNTIELLRNNTNDDENDLFLSIDSMSDHSFEEIIVSNNTLNLACTNARSVDDKMLIVIRFIKIILCN